MNSAFLAFVGFIISLGMLSLFFIHPIVAVLIVFMWLGLCVFFEIVQKMSRDSERSMAEKKKILEAKARMMGVVVS